MTLCKRVLALLLVLSVLLCCACVQEPENVGSDATVSQTSEIINSESGNESEPPIDEPPADETLKWPEQPKASTIRFSDLYESLGGGAYLIENSEVLDDSEHYIELSLCGSTLLVHSSLYSDACDVTNGNLYVYDVSTGNHIADLYLEGECYATLAGENRVLLRKYHSGEVTVTDRLFEPVYTYSLPADHDFYSFNCFATPDGEYLLYYVDGGTELNVVELKTGQTLKTFDIISNYYSFCLYGDMIYLCDYNGNFYVFDPEKPTELRAESYMSGTSYINGIIVTGSESGNYAVSPYGEDGVFAALHGINSPETVGYGSGMMYFKLYDDVSERTELCAADLFCGSLYRCGTDADFDSVYKACAGDGFAVFYAHGTGIVLWTPFESEAVELDYDLTSEELIKDELVKLCTALSDEYGINIYYGNEGNDFISDSYLSKTSRDTFKILSAVRKVSETLKDYPDGMVREIYSSNVTGVDLYLSGGLYSITDSGISTAVGLTYTYNNRRVIVADIDYSVNELRYTMFHELMHIIDDKLQSVENLSGRRYLSGWTDFLPKGADYYYSYHDNKGYEVTDSKYTLSELNEDKIYFVDAYSKTFPTEDRARVFEYLMRGCDGEGDTIYGEHLLNKARFLCVALRLCSDSLPDEYSESDALPWESVLGEIDMNEFDDVFDAEELAVG